MTRRQRRGTLIGMAVGVFALAVILALYALRDGLVFFYTPSEFKAKGIAPGVQIRLGGLVAQGSVKRASGTRVSFDVTDTKSTLTVLYDGALPDLFREGQGVVVMGKLLGDGTFAASTVLAKHDETYMPAEVAKALKEQGVWQGGSPLPNKK